MGDRRIIKCYALCTVEAGADLVAALAPHVSLAGIIGLSRRPSSAAVSGLVEISGLASRLQVQCHHVKSYGLSAASDRQMLSKLPIDVLLVCGWQRLVPAWLINHCKIGAFGLHGAPDGIAAGRGRSPQNWSLILGKTSFSLSLFKLEEGVDSGPVFATREFRYRQSDDIVSSYAMCTLLAAEMIIEAFHSGTIRRGVGSAQEGESRYFPQRLPEDGEIDWTRSAEEVCRFVAALTRPYPGATTSHQSARFVVWRARPLSLADERARGRPGQVVLLLSGRKLVVAAGRGLVLIDELERIDGNAPWQLSTGDLLESADFGIQMRQIIQRHRTRYPDMPLRPDILDAASQSLRKSD